MMMIILIIIYYHYHHHQPETLTIVLMPRHPKRVILLLYEQTHGRQQWLTPYASKSAAPSRAMLLVPRPICLLAILAAVTYSWTHDAVAQVLAEPGHSAHPARITCLCGECVLLPVSGLENLPHLCAPNPESCVEAVGVLAPHKHSHGVLS